MFEQPEGSLIYIGRPLRVFFCDREEECRPYFCRTGDSFDVVFMGTDNFFITIFFTQRPILSCRIVEVIRLVGEIGDNLFPYIDSLSMGVVQDDIDKEIFRKVMEAVIPEKIIKNILENGNQLELEELALEISRGGIPWRPEFQEFGIENPIKMNERVKEEDAILERLQAPLKSYCEFLKIEDGALISCLEAMAIVTAKTINDSDELIVATSGIIGLDHYDSSSADSLMSAEYIVFESINWLSRQKGLSVEEAGKLIADAIRIMN
jgi:hypothetical protein